MILSMQILKHHSKKATDLFLLLITSLKTAKIKGALKSMKNLKKYTTVIRRMLKCFSNIQTESFSLRI